MILLLNKPYGVLCQFTDPDGRATLTDYVQQTGVYAAGRLDADSEGLLLLTDDGQLAHRTTDPRFRQPKTYWAQVEGIPTAAQLDQLRHGVQLRDGLTAPAQVEQMTEPAGLWPRHPPIRFRVAIPTRWIALTISEGRNRQVRRMTAAVGLPTLRLIRERIGAFVLAGLQPGEIQVVPTG